MVIDPSKRDAHRTTVRVYRLGEEPRDDFLDSTTAQERLAMLRELTERAWKLSGRPFPSYSRREIPVRVTRAE